MAYLHGEYLSNRGTSGLHPGHSQTLQHVSDMHTGNVTNSL